MIFGRFKQKEDWHRQRLKSQAERRCLEIAKPRVLVPDKKRPVSSTRGNDHHLPLFSAHHVPDIISKPHNNPEK